MAIAHIVLGRPERLWVHANEPGRFVVVASEKDEVLVRRQPPHGSIVAHLLHERDQVDHQAGGEHERVAGVREREVTLVVLEECPSLTGRSEQ